MAAALRQRATSRSAADLLVLFTLLQTSGNRTWWARQIDAAQAANDSEDLEDDRPCWVQCRASNLKPGARLVREWRGRTHTVTVAEDGFEYAGTRYPSLTKIAKKITGAHWSGPRFFGLPAAAAERPNNGESGG